LRGVTYHGGACSWLLGGVMASFQDAPDKTQAVRIHCRAAGESVGLGLMCLAIPGKITSVIGEDPLTRMGKIDFGGILKEASLAYVPEAKVGDYVIVHVGFAISRVDEEEAQKVFDYLRQMDELAELQETGSLAAPIHKEGE
jgi:hydrogenase expression/formation protein HypC